VVAVKWRMNGVRPRATRGRDDSRQRGEAAEGKRPRRNVALVRWKRMDTRDATPLRDLLAKELAGPAFFDPVMAIPGQRRHDVQLMSSRRELAGDARDHRVE